MLHGSKIEIHPQNKLPYAISSDQTAVLVAAIAEGNFPSAACRIAGVNPDTFQDWMVRGGDPGSSDKGKPKPGEEVEPYKSFCLAILAAESSAEQAALRDVRRAGSHDWRASAWFLSRRQNANWGEKNQGVQVATTGNVTVFLPDNSRDTSAESGA